MKKLIGSIFVLATVFSIAQINFSPQMLFHKEINFGGQRDNIFSAIPITDGYVISGKKIVKDGENWLHYSHVTKFNSNSDLIWEYNGVENTGAYWQSLAPAPNGIFLGEGWDITSISKIDNSGNLVWKKNIGTHSAPVIAANENILVAVPSHHASNVVKIFDLDGNELDSWSIPLEASFATILNDGYLYILGEKTGGVLTNKQSEIIKTDLQGNIVWQDTLMDVHGLRGAIDINGNLYVSGFYFPNAQSWYRTVKYDLNGNRIWERLYDGDLVAPYNQSNYVNSVIAHPMGGCVVVGDLVEIGGNDPNKLDGGAIAYSPNGDVYFTIRYDANPDWYITTHQAALFCPNDNCLMLFGKTWNLNPDTAQVLFMTKWDNVTGVEDEDYTLPVDISLSQNYPNPFNPTTTINYELSAASNVTIKVYDILGKEVAILVNEEKPPGMHSVAFNAATLPSGTYFYRLTADKFTETKKMVLLR